MANNYTNASILPPLPASLFSQAEIDSLDAACYVVCNRDGDALHLFGEMHFSTEGEDEDGREVNLLTLLQGKLRQLDPAAYPHIVIHGACHCDKRRPDEFGGFAYVITRDDVRSFSTWEWLETQVAEATGISPAPSDIDIDALLAERRQIAVIWSIEDVKDIRPDLSDDQCWEVLQHARQEHDAGIGITWEVLEIHAAALFGDAPETDAAEEA